MEAPQNSATTTTTRNRSLESVIRSWISTAALPGLFPRVTRLFCFSLEPWRRLKHRAARSSRSGARMAAIRRAGLLGQRLLINVFLGTAERPANCLPCPNPDTSPHEFSAAGPANCPDPDTLRRGQETISRYLVTTCGIPTPSDGNAGTSFALHCPLADVLCAQRCAERPEIRRALLREAWVARTEQRAETSRLERARKKWETKLCRRQ